MVIVAAVDRSDRADTVIREAEALAEAFNDTVHVLHVLTQSEFVEMGRTAAKNLDGSFGMDQVEEVAVEVAEGASTDLSAPSKPVGLVGDPAEKIVDYADKQDARYIVVTGQKRSPAGKVVFGSVTQSVLLNSSNPVVTSIK